MWLARQYARRIVNVNVNIVVAGLLALLPTVLIVHFSRHVGVEDHDKITIAIITFVADVVFDVLIYFVLHWLANHHHWRNRFLDKAEHLVLEPAHRGLSFIHDAGIVQFERMVLSPLLYGTALGLQHVLMRYADWHREWATIIGFVAAIALTRILHTLWMLRQERRLRIQRHAELALAAIASQTPAPVRPSDLTGTPPEPAPQPPRAAPRPPEPAAPTAR